MADETRVVRTAGVYGTFVLPGARTTPDGPADLQVTPEGTEITFEEWQILAKAAVDNQVVVRLDEDFPAERYAAAAQKREESSAEAPEAGTSVNGESTDTSTTGRRSRNGG